MVWPFTSKKKEEEQETLNKEQTEVEEEESDEFQGKYKYAPQRRDEEQPMDLGELQDIFSFSFIRGRPILNFFLAILWSIGIPILLYHILKPYIGQVLAMIVASAPPLFIVIIRMVKTRTFDFLGCVAGTSFLVSGILSIAEPDEKTGAICEGIVPLLVGVICVISVLPLKIGSFEFRPIVFSMASQIMPRNEEEDLQKQDDHRLTTTNQQHHTKQQRLEYLYTHMARFRHDVRVMTVTWGALLIVAFIVKVIIVMTSTNIEKAQIYGYILFGLATFFMMIFTWFYTKIIRGHVLSELAFWKEQEDKPMDGRSEAVHNANWGVNQMSNAYSQVLG